MVKANTPINKVFDSLANSFNKGIRGANNLYNKGVDTLADKARDKNMNRAIDRLVDTRNDKTTPFSQRKRRQTDIRVEKEDRDLRINDTQEFMKRREVKTGIAGIGAGAAGISGMNLMFGNSKEKE